MSKLTKRESVLVNALLLLLVVGIGFRFWIAPLLEQNKELLSQNQTLNTEKTTLDFLIANKEAVDKKLNSLNDEYNVLKETFSNELTNLMISQYAAQSGQEIISIQRGETQIKKIQTKSVSLNQYEYDIYKLIQQVEEKTLPEIIDETSTSEYAYQEINVSLKGPKCDCKSFLDIIDESVKTGYITSYSFDPNTNETNVTIGVYSLVPLKSNY